VQADKHDSQTIEDLRNPFLAPELGYGFTKYFHLGAEDRLGRPFILVIEGSIPNEELNKEGCRAAFGNDK
jgi:hydrogenase small subunit